MRGGEAGDGKKKEKQREHKKTEKQTGRESDNIQYNAEFLRVLASNVLIKK